MTDPAAHPPPRKASSAPANPAEEHHLLRQAPVPAVDVDGLNVVTAGTLMFAVAAVILAFRLPELRADGQAWWLGVCISGFLLGLIGLAYCWTRRRRRRAGLWNRN